MRITAICPISFKKIDENVVRLNGAFTILFLVLFTFNSNIYPVMFLLVDFALRSGKYSRFSPITFVSKKIARLLSIKPLLINAGSKIFAARIGFVFNLSIITSHFSGLNNLSLIIIGVFGLCAFLEYALGYCVACQLYPLVYKFTYHFKIEKLEI